MLFLAAYINFQGTHCTEDNLINFTSQINNIVWLFDKFHN